VTTRRSAAVAALVLGAAALVLAAVTAVQEFPRGPIVFGCVIAALAAGWYGVLRRGPARVLGLAAGGVLLAVAVALLVARDPLETVAIVLLVGAALAAARAAFRVHVELSRAAPPRRPVLLFNPRSGGGKAARFDLPREARARGIEPVELRPGDDLERLARDAVARGADALAMAGGDGSQAVVAAVAAEHGLPYACVPAGTRNHFALDLGVDRDDVVGALDALVDGGERVVDLAEVNGRVFVNNVSLGLYAEAVQRTGYREAKLRTLLDAVPDALGPGAPGLGLSWDGPDGAAQHGDAAILVSNDRYRLGRAVGSGTRPRLDAGVLGVTVVEAPASRAARPWREWTAAAFDVHSDRPVAAGVDGEAVQLAPPLRFRARPAALRVRIARAHPGASPSALQPEGMWEGVRALARLAAGREPRPLPGR
jgi:hypothetical protein